MAVTVVMMKKWIEGGGSWLAVGMIMVQVIGTGLQLLSRVILNQGTFVFAYMFYRHVVAALCVLPFAIFFERGSGMKLCRWSFMWLFAVSLTGISMAMGLFYYGLRDTTATYSTNFLNLIPIVTFIFSTILGIEKLGLHTKYGKMKTIGATLCLGGALVIALYKGKTIHIIHHSLEAGQYSDVLRKPKTHWTRGTIFLLCSCLSYGLWFISQAKLFKIYPYKYWATLYTCLIASVQQVAIGLCIDRSKASWQLGWNLQLITIFYSGTLATAVSFCLISWAISKQGPTYPSMFNPVSLIFVAITEALILGEPTSVGSLLGMFLIVVGVYGFLWARNKEAKGVLIIKTSGSGEQAEKGAAAVVPQTSPPKPIHLTMPREIDRDPTVQSNSV